MRENNKIVIPYGWCICGGMIVKNKKIWEKTQKD